MKIDMDCERIAEKMQQAAKDMDFFDYAGNMEEEQTQLTEALYQLKAIAQNQFNSDYWRTFVNALEIIFND